VPVAAAVVLEDAEAAQQPQDPVEGIRGDLASRGELFDPYRALADLVGDAELGDRVQAR
jgi:hypothetical protein